MLFGITDHGHCWGFNGTESSLASLKESSGCVNASIMKPFCKESDKICAGAIRFWDVSSFIYLVLGRKKICSFDSLALWAFSGAGELTGPSCYFLMSLLDMFCIGLYLHRFA